MVTLIGSHHVKDVAAYQAAIEAARASGEAAPILQRMGVVKSNTYRQFDGSRVVVIHTFNDLESVQTYQKMMETAETQTRLEQMGAILPTTLWLVEEM